LGRGGDGSARQARQRRSTGDAVVAHGTGEGVTAALREGKPGRGVGGGALAGGGAQTSQAAAMRDKRARELPATCNRESRELSAPRPSNTVPAQQHSFLHFCEFKYKIIITFYR
jgi:hypothetical protein